MSVRAADDADAITANIRRIRDEAIPRCPMGNGMTLYACLRTIAKCQVHCPHKDAWRGPEAA